ncbi:hypothetical protein OOT33_12480 [Sphingobium sp. DEHP117]|nr:hypothetical protein [Sphingobium sp. DEHP117]
MAVVSAPYRTPLLVIGALCLVAGAALLLRQQLAAMRCGPDGVCARRAGRASSLSPAYWSARHCSGRVIAMSDVVPELHSTLTCPHCGHQATETMPTNACQFFYDCRGCGAVLKPKQGDCCVFWFLWRRSVSADPDRGQGASCCG